MVHAVRMARRVVRDRGAVLKLFDELAPRYQARRGGYTRIVKLGQRPGDAAPMSLLELIPDEGAPASKESADKGAKGQGAKAKGPAAKGSEKQAEGGASAVKKKAAAVLKGDRDEAGESKSKKKPAAKAKSKKDE